MSKNHVSQFLSMISHCTVSFSQETIHTLSFALSLPSAIKRIVGYNLMQIEMNQFMYVQWSLSQKLLIWCFARVDTLSQRRMQSQTYLFLICVCDACIHKIINKQFIISFTQWEKKIWLGTVIIKGFKNFVSNERIDTWPTNKQ